MTRRASVRELRNHTSEVIERASREGSITVTAHGRPIATLTPPPSDAWAATVQQVISALGEPYDSGIGDLLAADDDMDIELDTEG